MDSKYNKNNFQALAILLSLFLFTSFAFAQIYIPNTTDIDRIVVQQERLARKEQLMLKINQIESSQKRYMAEKITNEMDGLNETWVNHFDNVLNKLEEINQKIKSRAEKAAFNGKDVSAVRSAIEKSEISIKIARSTVNEQAKRIYIVDPAIITNKISSNQDNLIGTFRTQFKKLRDDLKDNLFSIRDGAMRDARNDVREAFLILADIPEVNENPQQPIN